MSPQGSRRSSIRRGDGCLPLLTELVHPPRVEKVTESCVRATTRPNFPCVSPQRCCLCFWCNTTVHENLDSTAFALASMAMATPGSSPDLLSLVASLDAALLPCLPARELQAADRSTHPSDQGAVDVERHVADFMEAAKSLQSCFIRIQHQHQPTREEALRKEVAGLEAELEEKDALLEKQNKLLQRWQGLLEAQKNIYIQELERV